VDTLISRLEPPVATVTMASADSTVPAELLTVTE
jgi:hypothetical protein